jgi:hypothetical protein
MNETDRYQAPISWNSHWDSMPNSVRQLWALLSPPGLPFVQTWHRIQGWGQLCFDDAAARMTAYHMYNRLPFHGSGWSFHKWRCDMDGPLIGDQAKLEGKAPDNFKIFDYVHR